MSWEYTHEYLQINFQLCGKPKNQFRFIIDKREPMLFGKRKQLGITPLG